MALNPNYIQFSAIDLSSLHENSVSWKCSQRRQYAHVATSLQSSNLTRIREDFDTFIFEMLVVRGSKLLL